MTTSISSDRLNKGAQQKLDAFERSIREQEDVIRRFDAYINDVLSGRILASKKVIAACKRHRRDMDKAANMSIDLAANNAANSGTEANK